MSQFADEREAKQFAVELILSQAERDGIPLSGLERKMLYFSETGPTIQNMAETAQEFENKCDSGQYEKKIGILTDRLQKRLQSDDRETLKAWSDALRKLSEGDHYLLALTRANACSQRPTHDFLKLCIAALIIILVGGGLLLEYSPVQSAREEWAFFMWLLAALVASVYLLLSVVVGRQRARYLLQALMSKIFRGPTVNPDNRPSESGRR
jgi:hypothetical protein